MHATGHTDRSGGGGGGGGSWRLPPDETLQVGDTKADEELYGEDGHNWRSIVFSLMVISFVIAGIVTAIYLLGYVDELLYWSGRRMRLEEFLRGELIAERLSTIWVNSRSLVYQSDDGGLSVLDIINNTVSVLVTTHTLRQLNVRGYECSSDLRYVLFKHNIEQVYQRTFTAHYTVYDVTNDHHMPLVSSGALQHAQWLGNEGAILFIFNNDIYVQSAPPLPRASYIKLTDTGRMGDVFNGVSDWLYQEEVTKRSSAVWGSPDGKFVLYVEYNDSSVAMLKFPWLSENIKSNGMPVMSSVNSNSTTNSFPEFKTVRYPTAGTPNPKVKLWIVAVENKTEPSRWEVKPPDTIKRQEYYLISGQWVGDDNSHVAAVWMSRAQNFTVITNCKAPNWTCVETHTEIAIEMPWLEIYPPPVYSSDGSAFLILAAVREGGDQHFTHIKHVSVTRQRQAVISHGKVEVTDILEWDEDNHLVYYLGSGERPGQRHLYVVRDPGHTNSNSVKSHDLRREEPKCLTCDEYSPAAWAARLHYTNCTYWRAMISRPAVYYVLECGGPGAPLAGLHNAETHYLERILYDTRPHRTSRLNELALPQRRSFEIQLGGGNRAHVQLYLPPSWREELRDAAFPVLVQIDGRPGSQQVSDEFTIDWGAYMSSRNDVVYVKLDVTGAKGLPSSQLRGRIGGAEVADQIAAIKYLLDTFSFLDRTRVAVWGWGYGAYVTVMLLSSQQKTLKCGIAVSPISDWLFYNSAFTERILGQPATNYKGYVECDARSAAKHVSSHALYMLHGLADLTAPYQHATQLARALADAGVLFNYQAYADEGHMLEGVKEHVYKSMEDYLRNCLDLDPEDAKLPPPDR